VQEEKEWVEKPGVRVYADGSVMGGGVGAAAAIYKPGVVGYEMLHYHLGPSKQYTSYDADLVGFLLGVELLYRLPIGLECMAQGASIAADNLAALLNAKGKTSQPGHYLFDELHRAVSRLHAKHPRTVLTLRWVPGHRRVEGNETVDKGAKEAAKGRRSPSDALPETLHLEHLLFTHNCWMFSLPKASPPLSAIPPESSYSTTSSESV